MAAPYCLRSLAYSVARVSEPRMVPTRSAQAVASPRLCHRVMSSASSNRVCPSSRVTGSPSWRRATGLVRSAPDVSPPRVITPRRPLASPVRRSNAERAPCASTAVASTSSSVSASRERFRPSTTVSFAVAGCAPARRRRSAASVGPRNAASASPRPSSSAITATSTAVAQGFPSPSAVRNSRQPAAATVASSLPTRSASSSSATVAGPSRSTTCAAESRKATCSGERRTSTQFAPVDAGARRGAHSSRRFRRSTLPDGVRGTMSTKTTWCSRL